MKWFSGITSLNELRKQYKDLTKKHHPDRGGAEQDMKEINAEYEELSQTLQFQNTTDSNEDQEWIFKEDGYREVLNYLLNIPDLEVELIGSWLWVDGNTFKHKKDLKKAGLFWASKKKKWYWRPPEQRKKRRGKPQSMKKIRNKYGSNVIKQAEKTLAIS